jgi:hypothetical protein
VYDRIAALYERLFKGPPIDFVAVLSAGLDRSDEDMFRCVRQAPRADAVDFASEQPGQAEPAALAPLSEAFKPMHARFGSLPGLSTVGSMLLPPRSLQSYAAGPVPPPATASGLPSVDEGEEAAHSGAAAFSPTGASQRVASALQGSPLTDAAPMSLSRNFASTDASYDADITVAPSIGVGAFGQLLIPQVQFPREQAILHIPSMASLQSFHAAAEMEPLLATTTAVATTTGEAAAPALGLSSAGARASRVTSIGSQADLAPTFASFMGGGGGSGWMLDALSTPGSAVDAARGRAASSMEGMDVLGMSSLHEGRAVLPGGGSVREAQQLQQQQQRQRAGGAIKAADSGLFGLSALNDDAYDGGPAVPPSATAVGGGATVQRLPPAHRRFGSALMMASLADSGAAPASAAGGPALRPAHPLAIFDVVADAAGGAPRKLPRTAARWYVDSGAELAQLVERLADMVQ